MEPNFEKASEIYFRLGIIYKQQQKYMQSLEVSGYRAIYPFYELNACPVTSVSNTLSKILHGP